MPRRKADPNSSPAKPRADVSPGNSDGYLAMKDWGSKETRVAVEIITRVILDNRAAFRAEPALQPWNWNGGDPINQRLRQLLTKICKDYEVDFSSVAATRSPQKRAAGSAEDGEDKKPTASPKKPRPSPAKKAVKKQVTSPSPTDPNEDKAALTDGFSVSEESRFTPSPCPTPKKKVSGSSPMKKPKTTPTTPKKIKEEPLTPVKKVAPEEKIAEDVHSPSPEDKMDVDDKDVDEDEDEEPPLRQTRPKKRVISDDYSPSRSATPAPTSGSGFASDALCFSPNRPKRGCAKQKNYNLALTYDGLDEYLKEKEGIERDSDEEGQSEEGDEEGEDEAADDDAGCEDEDEVNAVDEQQEK